MLNDKYCLHCLLTPIHNDKLRNTVYPKKYAHGFVVLCFVVVMQSFIMNSHEVFIHIHQGCFAGTGAIVRLPQCQWSKPDGYGKISQCITTTKHSKAKTVCIFLGIYCILVYQTPDHYDGIILKPVASGFNSQSCDKYKRIGGSSTGTDRLNVPVNDSSRLCEKHRFSGGGGGGGGGGIIRVAMYLWW